MLVEKESFTKIAKTLGRGLSTISVEVNKNGGREEYSAEKADHRAYLRQYRKKKECNKVAMDPYLSKHAKELLCAGCSPEGANKRISRETPKKKVSGKSMRGFVKKRPARRKAAASFSATRNENLSIPGLKKPYLSTDIGKETSSFLLSAHSFFWFLSKSIQGRFG